MTIDSVTAVQYSGYFQAPIRDMIMRKEAAKKAEDDRVKEIIEEQRKKVWNVLEGRGKSVDVLV